jgi:hypothetical protein
MYNGDPAIREVTFSDLMAHSCNHYMTRRMGAEFGRMLRSMAQDKVPTPKNTTGIVLSIDFMLKPKMDIWAIWTTDCVQPDNPRALYHMLYHYEVGKVSHEA